MQLSASSLALKISYANDDVHVWMPTATDVEGQIITFDQLSKNTSQKGGDKEMGGAN